MTLETVCFYVAFFWAVIASALWIVTRIQVASYKILIKEYKRKCHEATKLLLQEVKGKETLSKLLLETQSKYTTLQHVAETCTHTESMINAIVNNNELIEEQRAKDAIDFRDDKIRKLEREVDSNRKTISNISRAELRLRDHLIKFVEYVKDQHADMLHLSPTSHFMVYRKLSADECLQVKEFYEEMFPEDELIITQVLGLPILIFDFDLRLVQAVTSEGLNSITARHTAAVNCLDTLQRLQQKQLEQ